MEEKEINRMWDIDQQAQLGKEIKEEDKVFFNDNYEKMREVMEDAWTHWQFHSGKV